MLSTRSFFLSLLPLLIAALFAAPAHAEDGYDLWLRYRPVEQPAHVQYVAHATAIVVQGSSPTLDAAASELERGLSGLLGRCVVRSEVKDGAIVLASNRHLAGIGDEGFVIRSARLGGHRVTLIAANRDIGVLYGAYAYLRLIQTARDFAHLDIADAPKLSLRMLDHWDNLDRTVERGYAGRSLWNWDELPRVDGRMVDYARANASVGINAAVLNNVNADARILTAPYLRKVAALADAWRPYGIKVYLSARFSAPIEIGGLSTADPLDPGVRAWWRAKADEIYRAIPDFGGLVVKANSEGQPGPQSYGRTHADGANMLAAALAPHGGTLIWRAFVYSGGSNEDRAKQAFAEFAPLDGKFAPNVILQVKNGPIDFQPREPFHPLFGTMSRTRLAMEVQITKEYLGQSTHLAYLGPLWSEVLRSRAHRPRPQSEVRDTIGAMAGVANVGSDRNWSGSDFDQANWYAFGRLAWNPGADPLSIAEEWTRLTWGNDARLVKPVVSMMTRSREAVVDYMTPLGLAHQMGSDHHYGPAPWAHDQPAALWNPTYYNRADANGIGFDRTASGSNAVAQYAPELARCFADLRCVPDKYLLWFHHVPWTYRLHSGASLWDALVAHYDRGVAEVAAINRGWAKLKPFVDRQRHRAVAAKLNRQLAGAKWWRDASIAYWQSLAKLPLPEGSASPPHALSWYQAIHFDTVPGYLAPRIEHRPPCVSREGEKPCAP
ncbi:MAG: alpha-glucuronidase [Sphingomonadales bacterium]|nr:alpha-glucuronidase [Sphingomonadales bacterium]